MRVYYDFHIHSALSPCGDEDMTPLNIVGMAKLIGLDVIAVTDHKGKEPFMLLAPKKNARHKYFNLRYGRYSQWYGTIDQALNIAREYCGLSNFSCWVCKRRYYRLMGGKKNA